MEITILETAEEVGRAAAEHVAWALRRSPGCVLGLPSGRTPIEAYAELCRLHARGDLDFSRAHVFLLDEYVGFGPDHRDSFRRFLAAHLLSGINADPTRVHSPDGLAADPVYECERYEQTIASVGGLDLVLLGIGVNGHIGFNEPADALEARTHRAALHESTRLDNAELFGGAPACVPGEALSMGMGTILGADRLVLMATGERKAPAVRGMVRGPVTTRLPASFLQLHPRVDVLLDRPAAQAL